MKYIFSTLVTIFIFAILAFMLCNTISDRNGLLSIRDQELIQANKTITELKKANYDLSLDRDNTYDLYIEERTHRKWDNLRNFDSIKELKEFLKFDNTNESIFVDESYDCDDFSIALQENAAQKGYRISLQVFLEEPESHMMNFAIIENPRKQVIFIEPQNDQIEEGPYFDKE